MIKSPHPVFRIAILLVLSSCLVAPAVHAQRIVRAKQKLEDFREESWPPQRVYTKVSLGYALQRVFEKHFQFCGFSTGDERRDYIPPDISKFLGRRDLRTRVETADMNGGSLLNYIFAEDELRTPLDVIRYSPTNVLQLNEAPEQFVVNPAEHFDSYILTKNCGGDPKAALDAGIEPPYAAFKAALNTDDQRQSSVLALSGSFVSPLKVILEARDARTTELMLRLWVYYQQNPAMIGRAYYLREFEGVMIKHIAQADEARRLESELGINVNIPLGARLKSNFGLGRNTSSAFSGTDWETIVYADFAGNYSRESIFAPLPGPRDIRIYFESLRPVFEKPKDFPLLTEGAQHRHFLIVEGVPEAICRQPWSIELITPGVYNEGLRLEAGYFEENGVEGCRFTVSGQPAPALFKGPPSERQGKVPLRYRIRSAYPVGKEYLTFNVDEELATSAHPIVHLETGDFDLSMQKDRRFAFQWKCTLEVEDGENPVDLDVLPYINNILVRRSDQQMEVGVARIEADPRRRLYTVTLETRQTWPLEQIDAHNMVNFNLNMDVHLQNRRSPVRTVRPVKGILSLPSIRPAPQAAVATDTVPPPVVPVVPDGGSSRGGTN